LKKFNEIINDIVSLNEQEVAPPAAPPMDPNMAPSPAPGAGEQPDASPGAADGMNPAAEVTLVRLLLKALVMNLQDTDLSTLSKIDTPTVTQENAEQVKQDIISVINSQQTRGDNEDRVDAVQDTMNNINEKNSKSMLNQFVQLMKQYSDVNINQ
jgi:predicted lipid-binding transport protein (Tim44 family)